MKNQARLFTLFTLAAGLSVASAADITGTITLKGTPPPEKELPLDPTCGKLHTKKPTTHFYVADAKGNLADVVVFLKDLSGKSTGASAKPQILDQKGCEYIPYISAVQTGQKVLAKNSDPFLHNVHSTPAVEGNKEENKAQMGGGPDIAFSYAKAEMFLRFKCDVHPWMFAYVNVFDHPYFAVSAADGSYKIANVPAGKYTLVAQHRKGGTIEKQIEVKDSVKADFTIEAK
jgi:hypothetical protein